MVIFFFASAGASAAYLTVSEIFPMETRALAIAFFYAVGTGLGGIIGPVLFGNLIATKRPFDMAIGYVIGGVLMVGAGLVEVFIGVDAEKRRLEEIASPVSAVDGSAHDESLGSKTGPYPSPGRRIGRSAWSPIPQTSTYPSHNPYLAREVDRIVDVLPRTGSMRSMEIARRAGAKYWGPGRFRTAMRSGLAAGRIRRVGWNRFAAGNEPGRPNDTL